MKIKPGQYWLIYENIIYTLSHISNQMIYSKEEEYEGEKWNVLVFEENKPFYVIDTLIMYGRRPHYKLLTLNEVCQLL